MASTEQSLPQAPQASMGINPSVSPQSQQAHLASEPLVCQWQGCQQPNHPSPEALYEHVCENHIGRKSTNNLNLQCFWGSCRTTTVKRDHITSHIRVHVPLKPHKCDFCQKSFKRPQDLKKHVKTHADESVLFNSPQQSVPGSRQAPNVYQIPGNGRPDGSYGEAQGGHPHMGYPYGNGQGAFQGGNGMPGQGFGYPYNVPQTSSYGNDNGGLTESRKRAHDTLNEFFGDVKRRNIDAGQYQDLGARFSAFLQMFAPFAAGGWNGGYNPGFAGGPGGNVGAGFDGGNGGQYQTQAAPPMANYTPPFPELRTKNDLMSIDQFLEQLQNTVYDNEGAATSGAFNPIAGMQHQGINFPRRPSNSPPRFQGVKGAAATPGSYSSTSFAASSTLDDAPSFGSGGSPQHAQAAERPQGGSLYPTLPSFHSLDNPNAFASASNGSMPPSSLGPQYEDFDGRRRFSGGLLQRAQPPTSDVEARAESMLRAEAAKDEAKSADSGEQEPKGEQQDIKLPSVSEIERENEQQDKQEDRKESEENMDSGRESWENNMRTIATMRDYVRARLQRGEFDGSEDGNRTPRAELPDVDMKDVEEAQATTPKREGASLYPVLRPVEA